MIFPSRLTKNLEGAQDEYIRWIECLDTCLVLPLRLPISSFRWRTLEDSAVHSVESRTTTTIETSSSDSSIACEKE